MIKLGEREMKNLSRILSVMLCFAPLVTANAAGPVATTAGSNLTAYNPSNAMNNQWANLSNGRYDSANAPSAKADFGNCNALILRCAQPKCANGGCSDASVAAAIVKGCVQSNKTCAQYGDDLVEYMSAQLVASSNAKINEQQMAAQQAAAAAAQQQSEQQMQQMQYQMQQMQEQMAQQQAESAQQLQAALAEQAAQNQAALESMKTAATESAKETEAGVSAYQQDAINRGVSEDILARQTITGQIMTEIENAEVSLKAVKTAMNTAFEYAGCDARGNNCSGPKRVKKWRELATEFLTPYDNAIDNIYDALVIAQTVGVDLSQIYMMLNNSCNRWGQYLCPQMTGGSIQYPSTDSGQKGIPQVCTAGFEVDESCAGECFESSSCNQADCKDARDPYEKCLKKCNYKRKGQSCQPCTLVKVLTESTEDKDAVYEGWVNADYSTDKGNTSVVACASSALDSSTLFARRTKNKNGAGLVDIDKLDTWLNQNEPRKTKNADTERMIAYCRADDYQEVLEKAVLSKSVNKIDNYPLCIKDIKDQGEYLKQEDTENCGYISPIYAICDTHQYNAGLSTLTARLETKEQQQKRCDELCKDSNSELCKENEKKELIETCKKGKPLNNQVDSSQKELINEIVALKVTAISQQMYKQYEYLNATLRRLKTQLEKAALTATLEAAGAKSEGGSSSGGLLGGKSGNDDATIHLAGANNCSNFMDFDSAYNCLQNNAALIKNNVSSNAKKACLQLQETVVAAKSILVEDSSENIFVGDGQDKTKPCYSYQETGKSCKDSTKANITNCANALNMAVMNEKRAQAQKNKTYGK